MKERLQGLLRSLGRARNGVALAHRKGTSDKPIRHVEAPSEVIIPMVQHIGAPCIPTVKKGDTVAIGDLIGDADAPLTAPIHASISGTVKDIREIWSSANMKVQAVVIESDGEDRVSEAVRPPEVNNRASFIAALRASGLVGLGGAGFPTYFKLDIPDGVETDTLIVNGAECEPYVTVDHRTMLEQSDGIFPGIDAIAKYLGIKKVIVGIEANKPDAIEALRQAAEKYDGPADVEIKELPTIYPQGAEKVLIRSTTGREVPPGKLPLDVGCVVLNVNTLTYIGTYLKTGMPLVRQRITVDGGAVKEPQNLEVPIGMKLSDVIDEAGGFKETPDRVLMGGPMMGIAQDSLEHSVVKHNNAITCLTKDDLVTKPERNCIRCGGCHVACPLNLMPMKFMVAAKHQDLEMLDTYQVLVCMECGCCSHVCPSGIPLVQHIRNGKALIKKGASQS